MKFKASFLAQASFIAGILLLQVASCLGCGVEWTIPRDHFDGVNEFGYVSYWEQIGTLDLDEETKFPLIIGFQSDRDWASPHLGAGWIFALLDSSFVQTGENSFAMTQPDGWTRRFSRAKETDLTLAGNGGWRGEIRGEVTTTWAECGWKLIYNKGKLVSISTPKNRTLNFEYNGSRVSEVKDGGTTLLKVDLNPNTNQISGFTANGKSYKIEQGRRPRVQVVSGQNLVGGTDLALSKLTFPNGYSKSYEFAVNQKIEPTLKIAGTGIERMISWSPASKLIQTDNEWSYNIAPSPGTALANAAIGRKNSKGEEEFWNSDPSKGVKHFKKNEIEEKVTTYTGGILKGKVRTIERNGGLSYKSKFDENGNLLAESTARSRVETSYDSNKLKTRKFYRDNKLIYTDFYEENIFLKRKLEDIGLWISVE